MRIGFLVTTVTSDGWCRVPGAVHPSKRWFDNEGNGSDHGRVGCLWCVCRFGVMHRSTF